MRKGINSVVLLVLVLNLSACTGCGVQRMTEQLRHTWLVEDIKHNNMNNFKIQWAIFGNVMSFKKDSAFEFPLREGQSLEPYGKWYVFRKGFDYYLKVMGCADTLFNQIYLIKITYRPANFGSLQVLELRSEHLYIIGTSW